QFPSSLRPPPPSPTLFPYTTLFRSSAFFVWYGLHAGLSAARSAALFLAGLFAWTLIEYLIHRFSFHYTPRGRIGMFFAYMIHGRSEEHTSELQSLRHLVCRLLLEKK